MPGPEKPGDLKARWRRRSPKKRLRRGSPEGGKYRECVVMERKEKEGLKRD